MTGKAKLFNTSYKKRFKTAEVGPNTFLTKNFAKQLQL